MQRQEVVSAQQEIARNCEGDGPEDTRLGHCLRVIEHVGQARIRELVVQHEDRCCEHCQCDHERQSICCLYGHSFNRFMVLTRSAGRVCIMLAGEDHMEGPPLDYGMCLRSH
jgi:hypothetical protein